MTQSPPADSAGSAVLAALLPIMTVMLVAYLVIGAAMPVLPLYVHHDLGLSTFMVGVVAGTQFAAALISRPWAGHDADARGPKRTMLAGLFGTAFVGVLYLLSLRFAEPHTSVSVLLAGRALLGAAESFIITGALTWGVALAGPQHTGKVMSWVGTALYGAFALGAPIGSALYDRYGFTAIGIVTIVLPLAAALLVARRHAVTPQPHPRLPLGVVLRAVWRPGSALALSGVGFGAITTFVALLFAERGWGPAWLAFTILSVGFVTGRGFFGHLPDRIGGAKVACACVLLEAAGQAVIWRAPSFPVALTGVGLSGLGYSLVYPSFGVEAVRRAPERSRGVAMGTYTAFLDLSLGLSSPALGFVAGTIGLGNVFLVSTLVVLIALGVAIRMLRV